MSVNTLHVDLFVILLMVTAAVAMGVKWIKLPYSISLVIVGLLIGVFHLLPPIQMTPELVMLVFLPALLFEASWNLHLPELRANWLPITILAVPGMIISMAVIAFIMHAAIGVPLNIAFLFGAMISATDPISVLALFRKLGMNARLTTILEGESLFNDGTAVVLYKLVLALIVSQTTFSLAGSALSFFVVCLGGAAVGAGLGFLASKVTSYFDDHLLEITLTTILAYSAFLLADELGLSPVISVVAAGIVMGSYGSRGGMSATTRVAVNSFWEYAAFLVNSFVFLLIGLQVKFDLLQRYAVPIGVGIGAILVARLIVVYGLTPTFARKNRPIPWNWRHLLFWGGLRGSLSMALALSLPATLPNREAILITTFGVVLFTLLVPGLTIEPMVRLLKMNVRDENIPHETEAQELEPLINKTLETLELLNQKGALGEPAYLAVRTDLEDSLAKSELVELDLAESLPDDDR